MSSHAVTLDDAAQALRLADDLDARRRGVWEDVPAAISHDGSGSFHARSALWSEALSDDLRREHHLAICDDVDDAEDWWQWLTAELAFLIEQAADWGFIDWAADLLILQSRLMRKAVALGWRVVLDQAPDVWVEDRSRQLAREAI